MTLSAPTGAVGWTDLWHVFGRIGLLSFGGPAAQIALMHRELVDGRKWLSEQEYLRALSFCMLLPGPEAMQLATYAGWKLRGIRGGLLAGTLFVAPGALLILGLASLYVAFGSRPVAEGLFLGVKACVVVIVIEALLRVSRRALSGRTERAIAVLAFAAIFLFGVPFPAVILAAAAIGVAGLATSPPVGAMAFPGGASAVPVLAAGGVLWALPLLAAWAAGADFLLVLGLFFSKLAVVTFGGAYAVLAYMTQEVVQDYGWVTTAQMMDALGLAETTPGPLILVTEFVAFLAGYGQGGWRLAMLAAAVTLWVTFVPCFLWIFAFAPYVEWVAGRPRLAAALRGVTAAVVGVIGSLALWFALHLAFADLGTIRIAWADVPLPVVSSLDLRAVAISVAAGIALLRFHIAILPALAASAAAGVALTMGG
jgi:chromate transporter